MINSFWPKTRNFCSVTAGGKFNRRNTGIFLGLNFDSNAKMGKKMSFCSAAK